MIKYTKEIWNDFENKNDWVEIEVAKNEKGLYVCPTCGEVLDKDAIHSETKGTTRYNISLNDEGGLDYDKVDPNDRDTDCCFYCSDCFSKIDVDEDEVVEMLEHNYKIINKKYYEKI